MTQYQEDFLRGQRIAAKLQRNEDVSLDEACLVIWSEGFDKDIVRSFRHQMFSTRFQIKKFSQWKDIFLVWKENNFLS